MSRVGREKKSVSGFDDVSNDTVLELVERVKVLRVAMEVMKKESGEDESATDRSVSQTSQIGAGFK